MDLCHFDHTAPEIAPPPLMDLCIFDRSVAEIGPSFMDLCHFDHKIHEIIQILVYPTVAGFDPHTHEALPL